MDIAVVGTPEFTLGFQLAGVDHLLNPEGEDAMVAAFKSLLNNKSVVKIEMWRGAHLPFN